MAKPRITGAKMIRTINQCQIEKEPISSLLLKKLTAKVSGGEAVRLSAELDPKAKWERPALKKGAAHQKALGHESGAALQE